MRLRDQSVTWNDLSWLKSVTKLPLVLKGILRPDDAELGVACGADAIIVSNHGARQVDGVPATIDVLHSIRQAVGHRCQVYMDGGVRLGTDVFKALAMGADMVFVGRPIIWGLAYAGQKGVERTLELLTTEFDTVMALSGCATVSDIGKEFVVAPKSAI